MSKFLDIKSTGERLKEVSDQISTIGIEKYQKMDTLFCKEQNESFYSGMYAAYQHITNLLAGIIYKNQNDGKEISSELKELFIVSGDFTSFIATVMIQKQMDENELSINWENITFNQDELKYDVIETYLELSKAFANRLYVSAIVLCGKLIEICLHELYFKKNGTYLLSDFPGIGLGKTLGKLRDIGCEFPTEIDSTINLINAFRNANVHTRTSIKKPDYIQTKAVILLTKDIITSMFGTN